MSMSYKLDSNMKALPVRNTLAIAELNSASSISFTLEEEIDIVVDRGGMLEHKMCVRVFYTFRRPQ